MFEDKGVFIQQSVYLMNTILHLILLEIFVLNKDSSMQSTAVILQSQIQYYDFTIEGNKKQIKVFLKHFNFSNKQAVNSAYAPGIPFCFYINGKTSVA